MSGSSFFFSDCIVHDYAGIPIYLSIPLLFIFEDWTVYFYSPV